MESKKTNIKGLVATGAILISVTPLICNGEICELSHTPDLPVDRSYYDFSDLLISGAISSSVSGTIVANFNR